MTDIARTTSIRTVVSKIKSRGRISEKRDPDIFQMVMDGMRQLSLFSLNTINVVKLDMDSLNRVTLPDDYLNFLAIGIPVRGKLSTFTRNDKMTRSSDQTFADDSFDTEYGENVAINDANIYAYGQGGGTNDVYFYIDERKGYIQLKGYDKTTVTLHYISHGINQDSEDVYIPAIAEEALIAFAMWMDSIGDPTKSISERREFERFFGDRLSDLDDIQQIPSVDELMDTFYSTIYQTIKRL
jgi:hypothetical protein